MVFFALIMGFFWFMSTAKYISKFGESIDSIDLPKIEFPNFDIPIEDNSDQVKDWTTYVNSEYGFEIKYPSDWIIENNKNGTGFTTNDLLEENKENDKNCKEANDLCNIYFSNNIVSFQYIKENIDLERLHEFSKVILNNIEWTRYRTSTFSYIIGYRNGDYDFSIFDSTQEDLLKKILSTFKFTN